MVGDGVETEGGDVPPPRVHTRWHFGGGWPAAFIAVAAARALTALRPKGGLQHSR